MLSPPKLVDETRRLEALHRLNILGTPAEDRFDRITRLASRVFDVPIAAVSLVDAERQWFKSSCGWTISETLREISFCGHAIANDEAFVVENALEDERFADNPLVTAFPSIRFYAGQPLRAIDGSLVGTLCLIGHEPRTLREGEKESLRDLARMVENELGPENLSDIRLALMGAELTQLIDAANAPIFGIDAEGLVNEWNRKAAEITGYTKEEVLDRQLVEDFITDDYKAAVTQVLDDALAGEETSNYEFPLYTKDGQRVMVLLNATTRRNTTGKIVGVLGVGQDITKLDAYRSEKELVAAELTQLIDAANAPIFGIDAEGLVNEWNRKAAEITGYTKEEVLGRQLVEDFITDDYKAAVTQVLDDALAGEETSNYEFPLYTKDGQRVMVLLNATTRRNTTGKIVGVLGVGQDITELDAYRSQKELVAAELTQLIDTANAPIFGIDAEGLVNEWNRKAAEITGYTKEEVLGRQLVEDFITDDYKAAVTQVLDDALAGEETSNYEFPLYTKDGQRVMVLLNATTRRNTTGKIVGVLGVGQDITELDAYRSEKELVAAELTQLIDTANAPIFGIDAEGLVNEWNRKAAEITGYTKEEVLGRQLVEDFITDDYKAAVTQVLDDALAGEETSNYEFPLYTKDGQRVMVLLNATTRRDTTGNIVGVLGVGQDITKLDAYRSEKELVAAELTQLIDTANAPIFGIDAEGLVNEWNRKAAEITGYTKEEVLGRQLVEDFITDDYKAAVTQVLDDALAGEETSNYEFPLYTKDGQRVMVLLNATTRRDTTGNIVGVLGVGQDITKLDAYRSEKELVAAELTQLIDTANAPIFGIDAEGLVNEWNRKAAEITGYTKEEVLGRQLVEDFITDDYKAAVTQVLDDALAGEETSNYEFPLYTKDGQRVMVLLNATTRRNTTGKIVGVLGVGQDITERKMIEGELQRERDHLEETVASRTQALQESLERIQESNLRLEEASRSKDQFLSSMSHELRTPLNIVLGNADLLRQKFFGDLSEKQSFFVEQIDGSGKHLLNLINDLLDMAKIDGGAMEVESELFSLDDCIDSTLSMMSAQFNEHNIKLLRVAPSQEVFVTADPRKCKQILLNIIANAVKYSPAAGSITVTSRREPCGSTRVSIRDTGIGIESEHLEKIFSEFHQVDRKRDESLGGTGIGLALTRRLVELQGGAIGVTSAVGQGSEFWFTLPKSEESGVDFLDTTPLPQRTCEYPDRKVLIAEDNNSNLAMVLSMLETLKIDAVVARDGEEAIAMAKQEKPDLILMDIRMPVMDGLEATRLIQGAPHLQDIPIVALTASADNLSRERAIQAGCVEHLPKPIQTKELFAALRRYL